MHQASIALRWPLGVVLTGWNYMWRTTPMWQSEYAGRWPQDGPPPDESGVSLVGVQRPEDGAGPLFPPSLSSAHRWRPNGRRRF